MGVVTWALAAVLACIAAAGAGYYAGVDDGKATCKAAQDAQTVQSLTGLITSHQGLIDKAQAASRSMRKAVASRAVQDAQTTEDFKNALATTADSRADCVFPPDVMRQLAAARDRAAQAATSGIRGAVPSASSVADQR